MKYQATKPSPKLADYIRFYWSLESDHPYIHYGLANIYPDLVFHYHGCFDELQKNGKREHSFVAGIDAHTNHTRQFEVENGFGIFGISLYPHMLPLLFGIPANELTNQMVDLKSLVKTWGGDLEDKILNATTHQKRIEIIKVLFENQLSKSVIPQLPVFEALKYIVHTKYVPKVKQLTQDYFVSERQLERQFLKFTGFNPKQFIRISRFQRAIQFYGSKEMSLTEIAMDCGYYDQSHFINDFKQFSGIAPREYFSGKSPATEWRA